MRATLAAARLSLVRYPVAWGYVIAVVAAEIVYTLLPRADQAAVLRWASTNVHNLHTDPVGCLVASAFFPTESLSAWPVLIALALFGASRVLGNWRLVVVCASGHVIGTLVSEGIVGYRVTHGTLPESARFIVDVGPSYIVVAALPAAILAGGWLARSAALLDLALLAFVGDIFGGLTRLSVPAVGHTTAITVGLAVGGFFVWRRGRRAGQVAAVPALPATPVAAADRSRAADSADQPRPPA
jgi:hypothetical protein